MNRSSSDTAADLLAAGRRLFAQRGYDGASIRAITQEAASNLGAVTYHYGSKEALYAAVLRSVLQPLADRVVELATTGEPALDRVETVVRVFFDHLEKNPDQPRLLLQEITAGKVPPPDVQRIMRQVLGTLVRIVEEGQREGTIRDGNPLLLAAGVVAQPVYLTLISNVARQVADLDVGRPDVHRSMVEHAVTFARQGLARPPLEASR